MNIYFTAAIVQKDQYGDYYAKIVKVLEKLGHHVIHEHITKRDFNDIQQASEEHNEDHYRKVQRWISDADLVIAEASFPSTLNVGHEITLALEKGKPVVCLYYQGKISTFLKSVRSDKFIYEEYTGNTLEEIIKESLDIAQQSADTRFNFLISPSLLEYLDWIAKNRRIPRSVYLRRLIEADRDRNKDYKG